MTVKRTAIVILASLAAGTVLGLMLAPDSGEKTRRKLMKKKNDLHDRMQDMLDEGFELIEKLKGDASVLTRDAKGTARDAARHVRESASRMANG